MNKTIIVISGIDGSGKTSIIEGVVKALASKGQESHYVWLRYNHYFTKFLLGFCRLTGFTRYEYFEKSRVGYHNFYKSKIISWLFIILTYIDTLAVSIIKVYLPAFISNKTIICDRWVYDIVIDLEIDTHIDFTKGSFFPKSFKRLLPKNSLYFLIQRDYEKVRQVRDENMNDRNFSKRYGLYLKHSSEPDINVVDNNGSLEESINQVLNIISL